MRNEIYADYDEKFIKSTIVYAFEDNGSLYFSEDALPKNRVSNEADLGYKLKENSTISWTFSWSN